VENVNVSTRQGCNFHLRQIRATEAQETPNSAASSRADQCVTRALALANAGGSKLAIRRSRRSTKASRSLSAIARLT
jgi:hypothetical protein